ncbi:MAG: YbaB/EbfC family nucleoid-associated protein [Candidatus Omnitrophica bacterium]|nr:YbaB/EbfC family nucleoid-associated protein [Candidatus Omnitrophota bacterium]
MFDKIKQMMELRKQADKLKKELGAVIIEVSDVRGIKVVINGAQVFQSVDIDAGLLNAGNKNRLQMDLLRSINTAVKKSQQAAANKMRNTPGLNIPGLT